MLDIMNNFFQYCSDESQITIVPLDLQYGVAISVLQAYAEDEKNFEQVVWQAANQVDQLLAIFCCIH